MKKMSRYGILFSLIFASLELFLGEFNVTSFLVTLPGSKQHVLLFHTVVLSERGFNFSVHRSINANILAVGIRLTNIQTGNKIIAQQI